MFVENRYWVILKHVLALSRKQEGETSEYRSFVFEVDEFSGHIVEML